jgi:hypothetical protein
MATPSKRKSPTRSTDNGDRGGEGIGVDVYGRSVVDPTKNVLGIFGQESEKRDELRIVDKEVQNLHISYQEKLAAAETRRIDDMAELRRGYEDRIAEDLKVGVKTTSDQLAGQLIKETGSLAGQISTLNIQLTNQITTLTTSFTNQVAALTASITPRLADLERFRWEVGGKTSVTDPQITADLVRINAMLKVLSESKDVGVGVKKGSDAVVAWIIAAVMALFAFSGAVIAGAALFLTHGTGHVP